MQVGSNGSLARWVRDASQPYHWRRRQPLSSSRATALAMQQGLADVVGFHEGNAEELPFPDNHVDVALSFTVLEEGNADRMLGELVRVTKPGGRVAVMVRALDIPWVVNVPLTSRGENQSGNTPRVRSELRICRRQSVPACSSDRADARADVAAVCHL